MKSEELADYIMRLDWSDHFRNRNFIIIKKMFDTYTEQQMNIQADRINNDNQTMTKQEIAIHLSKIDWVAAEGDDPNEWDQIHSLRGELCKLEINQAVRLIFSVMCAKECVNKYPTTDIFVDMLQFKYVNEL